MARKTPPLVLVNWEDAYSRQNWIADEDVDENFLDEAYNCTMVGYLIRNHKDYIVVAARASGDGLTYGLLQRIPRGMVRKIRKLKV
jgi:hypothetical protein